MTTDMAPWIMLYAWDLTQEAQVAATAAGQSFDFPTRLDAKVGALAILIENDPEGSAAQALDAYMIRRLDHYHNKLAARLAS